MNDQRPSADATGGSRALSYAGVADAYDRARPSYPREAVAWLVGTSPVSVLEVGAGTGKLTDDLLDLGHDVLATDPLEEMLQYLRLRHADCRTAVAFAEDLPVASRTVDVVVSAQAFHWFTLEAALPEIARVLKPEGTLALVWNSPDDRIPWVRRLGSLIEAAPQQQDPTAALVASRLFGFVEEQTFRFWQPLRQAELRDLVRSRSAVAVSSSEQQAKVLSQVDDLYDEYQRGPDGLLMPYVTRCYKAVVRPVVLEESGPIHLPGGPAPPGPPDDDDGTPLFTLR
jgi:SAM-dependent methyltransferase